MSTSLSSIFQILRLNTPTKKSPTTHTATPLHKSFPQEPTNGILTSGLPEIPLSVVAEHDNYADCWIVIYDRVYDVTQFMHEHPGGDQVLLDYAGRDATLAFNGSGHSRSAFELLGEHLIGELPLKERIFRNGDNKVLTMTVPS